MDKTLRMRATRYIENMRTQPTIITRYFHKKLLTALAPCPGRYWHGLGLALLILLVRLPVVTFAKTSAPPMKFKYLFEIGGEPGCRADPIPAAVDTLKDIESQLK